jgi:sodium-dependent dicarboxylate transporter 2/3/5
MNPEIIISFIILILMITGFITEVFSLSVIALLGCLAFSVTGIIDHSTAFSGFSNDIVFMIAGTMVVGETMFQTGAAQFLGERIIKAVGHNERRMMFVLILSAGLLSAFSSNSSVMAMFLPLIRSVAASSNGRIKARHLVMPVGIATMVGGGCTIVGSTPQLVTQGLLADGGYRTFTFFELGYIGFPLLILLAVFYSTIGYNLVVRTTSYMPDVPEYMSEMKASAVSGITKANPKMYICFAILIGMVAGFLSGIWTVGTVAVLAALLCVVTGCISTKTALDKMGWNALIIVGATLGVAKGLNASGAAKYIANLIVNVLGENVSIVVLLFVVGFMCVIMSNLLSHTATMSILIPIFIPVAIQMGFDPTLLAYAITCFVACGYSTPLGVASYAMTLAEGYKFTDYFKIAGVFNLIAYVIMVLICSARFITGF